MENEKTIEQPQASQIAKKRKPANKKMWIGVGVFIVGMAALIAGIVLMVINFLSVPEIRDAEFLVQTGSFEREDAPSVIWDFTEVGKGKLTTNNNENTYDFIWAIEDGKLKIETNWLYDLNDEYSYRIDKDTATLTLILEEGAKEITFQAKSPAIDSETESDRANETESGEM